MNLGCIALFAIALPLSARCFAAEIEQIPAVLNDVKVGDWVLYKTQTKGPNNSPSSSTIRQEIVALTAEKVTVQTVTLKPDGSAEAISSADVQRKRPYGPLANSKETPTATGEESISVGSQSLLCKWVKVIQRTGNDSTQTITTLHSAPEVPLGGMVRLHVSFPDGQQTEQQLEAFGRGK